MKLLIADKITEEALALLKSNKKLSVEYLPQITDQELKEKIKDIQGLVIRTKTQVTKELLSHTQSLKMICRVGIGLDNVDIAACDEKSVKVYNTPVGNRISTAEHTLALLLALSRKISFADKSLKTGLWNREEVTGNEVYGKTLGIIGLGNIGREVARRAYAFGLKVIACDPYVQWSKAMLIKVRLHPLDMVLKNSDYVSMHVPLTQETSQMANKEFFKKMKSSSFFINTSRGAVVNEEALIEAIQTDHLKGAALDVYNEEPLKNTERFNSEKLILTPHVAGQTKESLAKVSLEAVDVISKFFA